MIQDRNRGLFTGAVFTAPVLLYNQKVMKRFLKKTKITCEGDSMKILKRLRTMVCTILAVMIAVSCVPAQGSDKAEAKGMESVIGWGIDVSAWQGDIDWNAVKASGVQFAFIKCGGTIYGFDDKFAQNMMAAQAAGIKTGVYIYSYATNVAEAAVEAQWIINACAPYIVSMPIVLDIENYRHERLDPLTNAMICQTFCQIVEAAGYYPMVYSSRFMLRDKIGPFGYDKWVAQWTDYCYDETAAFWQKTDSGVIPGIRGTVDIDYQFKDLSAYIIPYGFASRDGYVYFYENYRRQSNRFVSVNGGTYFVDAYGHVVAGALYPIGEYIYYFDATGLMQIGFVNLGDGLRYFDENGHMATGWTDLFGYTYYFDPAQGGIAVTGFISDGVYTYYFGPDGTLQKGLFSNGNSLYFADLNGRLQTGLITMSGLSFYFDPAKGGALLVNGTATDALGHVYVADTNGLAMMIR